MKTKFIKNMRLETRRVWSNPTIKKPQLLKILGNMFCDIFNIHRIIPYISYSVYQILLNKYQIFFGYGKFPSVDT